MTFINKEKVLNGVEKAVDVTNNVADKTQDYIKKNELDKKAKNMANGFGEGIKYVVKEIEGFFNKS